MSIKNYEKAKELIETTGGGDFEGTKSELLVAKAEAALGVKFPASYRRFLLEMGCGDFNGVEIFGVIDDNFENSAVPNGIWLTFNERNSIELDPAYVIVGEEGGGGYYAIDTRVTDTMGENPVVMLSVSGKQIERMADSFGSFFLNVISAVS